MTEAKSPTPARPWSDAEVRILVDAYCEGGKDHAAKLLGRDPVAVQSKFNRVKSDLSLPFALRKKARNAKNRRWSQGEDAS